MSLSDFESCWERVKELTGWTKQVELANFLGIQASSVSGAKKKGNKMFPRGWALKIASHYKSSAEWILGVGGNAENAKDSPAVGRMDGPNHQNGAEAACDCMSEGRRRIRRRLFRSGLANEPGLSDKIDIDLLQYTLDCVRKFQDRRPDALSQDEAGEAIMTIYSFCLAENRALAELICPVVLDWLNKHEPSTAKEQAIKTENG